MVAGEAPPHGDKKQENHTSKVVPESKQSEERKSVANTLYVEFKIVRHSCIALGGAQNL